jgi:AcrR family transcriptional regulator
LFVFLFFVYLQNIRNKIMEHIRGKKEIELLNKGTELFMKHGIKRVSIEEICRESGVSKMTFYKYFENKTALLTVIIEEMIEKSLTEFREILYSELPVEKKLAGILELKAKGTQNFSEEFIKDVYGESNPELKNLMLQLSLKSWNEISKDFRIAQTKGWFRKDFNPELMLKMTFQLIPLMTDPALLEEYKTPQNIIMEISRFFTYGILPLQEKK